jgi:transcriptional regulator with XRE-family HTH domain
MSGRKKWSETRDARFGSSNEARARYAAGAEKFRERLNKQLRTLAELRRARNFTQEKMAAVMGVSQAQVSRVENQADLYLSTLRHYIEALGGELQIRVAFPGSEWTEVAVGDITGIETSSSSYEPLVTFHDFRIPTATNVVNVVSATTAFHVFSNSTALNVTVAPASVEYAPSSENWVQAFQVCRFNPGNIIVSGTSGELRSSRVLKLLKAWGTPEVTHIAGYIPSEASSPMEIKARVAWLGSTELRVPDDTEDFVACARFKEG